MARVNFLAWSLAATCSVFAADPEVPSVPSKVLEDQKEQSSLPVIESADILLRPGVSVVAPIAYGHLNRIVTPFDNPQVRTVSSAQIQVQGQVIYLATEETKPITLFITPNGKESPALSLVLAPRQIPPREIRLKLPEKEQEELKLQTIREASSLTQQRNTPHVEHVKSIMKDLAKGRIPAGFVMRRPGPSDHVRCFQSGLEIKVGQVLEGAGLVLRIAVLRNLLDKEVEIDEKRCASAGEPVAVASWPQVRLGPNEQAELYVLSRANETPPESVRPSLIGGI
jgi:conjugal transfer pilus assembly protein TraK